MKNQNQRDLPLNKREIIRHLIKRSFNIHVHIHRVTAALRGENELLVVICYDDFIQNEDTKSIMLGALGTVYRTTLKDFFIKKQNCENIYLSEYRDIIRQLMEKRVVI